LKEVEGVGGGAAKGVVVQDAFGQGTGQGLAAELAAVELVSPADDFVEVQGGFGFFKYIYNYSHVRGRLSRASGAAARGTAQEAEGSELGMSC